MREHYEIFSKDSISCVYRRNFSNNELIKVATFVDENDALVYAQIKEGTRVVVRRHELDRIKENIDRIFDKL